MREFFRRKVAQKIIFSVKTGNRVYTHNPPYERVYTAEIISEDDMCVTSFVQSYDKTPSGAIDGDSYKTWGTESARWVDFDTLEEFWKLIISQINPSMVSYIRLESEE